MPSRLVGHLAGRLASQLASWAQVKDLSLDAFVKKKANLEHDLENMGKRLTAWRQVLLNLDCISKQLQESQRKERKEQLGANRAEASKQLADISLSVLPRSLQACNMCFAC